MKREFTTEIEIEAPAENVWQVMSDVERWPEWTPTVSALRRLDDGTFGVGSRVEIRQPRLPKAVWEVAQLVAGQGFTWESTAPGIRTVGSHDVAATDGGARVSLRIDQQGPMGAVAAIAWRGLIQRYVDTEAACLRKRVLELYRR